MKLGRWLAVLSMSVLPLWAHGQELEYAVEVGGMLGTDYYLGDANYHGFYQNQKVAAALMGRYNLNPRMSLKMNIAFGGIAGDAVKQGYSYPKNAETRWVVDEQLIDIGCQYEMSFWGYGMGSGYKGSRRIAPYIQLGLGATICGGTGAVNIPFGFGVKYKLKERWNVGLDWTIRFTTSDKIDRIEDPYNIKSGFLKNKDTYQMTMLYLSYDLCPKYRKCNNE